jgi:hypothetical protein
MIFYTRIFLDCKFPDSERMILKWEYSPNIRMIVSSSEIGLRYVSMQTHGIDFINFEGDSTIAFYPVVQKGIKDKQFIQMFINGRRTIK